MIFEYPFCYRDDYHLVGGRKVAHRYMIDTLDIDIPELSGVEAPIAANWTVIGPKGGEMHVRYADGRFYKPLTSDIGTAQQGFDAANMPARGRADEASTNHLLSLIRVHWNVGRYWSPTSDWLTHGKCQKAPRPDTIAAFLGSTHYEMKMLAEELAAGLRIVDGKVYTEVSEPVFAFEGNLQQEIVIHIGSTCYDKDHFRTANAVRGPFETVFVRLDDARGAFDQAVRAANVRQRYANLQIELPHAFTFDVAENAVARAVGKIVYEYAKVPSINWDRDALNEFLDIHRDYLAYLSDPEEHDILEIMTRARETIASQRGLINDKFVEFLRVVAYAENAPLKIKAGAIGTRMILPR